MNFHYIAIYIGGGIIGHYNYASIFSPTRVEVEKIFFF